jgi:tRNA(fMet)-specific endonuclease VapC
MKYLLDTNVISNIIRFPRDAAAEKIRRVDVADVFTSIIVSAELRYGYIKVSSARLERLIEPFLESIQIADWTAPSDFIYARLRDELEKTGRPIGAMDTMIAAHALAFDAIVVTDNEKHFSRVPGLKVENWLR